MKGLMEEGSAAGQAESDKETPEGEAIDGNRLRVFAKGHRLKFKCHEDNTLIISGKVGHIWEFDEERLAVTLLDLSPNMWSYRRKACLNAGMELGQDGDGEGTLLFDPDDAEQVEAALKVAEVKKTRWMSPEHRERLIEYGKATQFKSVRR
jgi:hypothetical protein